MLSCERSIRDERKGNKVEVVDRDIGRVFRLRVIRSNRSLDY